jgi:hypothetical protein
MIVAIHQPCYLPWLGYLRRMAQADLFVVLDHVQFERANYQNRTRIRMPCGGSPAPAGGMATADYEARWLTVPVLQRSQKESILEKEVDNRLEGPRHWAVVQLSTLRHSYREARFASLYLPVLKEIFSARWDRLLELNLALLEVLRDAFGIRTPLVRSSELGAQGAKSELILELCRKLGADTFLGGMGGSRDYLDREAFQRAGVGVLWQEFRHPAYPQCGSAPFIAGLSSIDLLLNCGPQGRHLFLPESITDQNMQDGQRDAQRALRAAA